MFVYRSLFLFLFLSFEAFISLQQNIWSNVVANWWSLRSKNIFHINISAQFWKSLQVTEIWKTRGESKFPSRWHTKTLQARIEYSLCYYYDELNSFWNKTYLTGKNVFWSQITSTNAEPSCLSNICI